MEKLLVIFPQIHYFLKQNHFGRNLLQKCDTQDIICSLSEDKSQSHSITQIIVLSTFEKDKLVFCRFNVKPRYFLLGFVQYRLIQSKQLLLLESWNERSDFRVSSKAVLSSDRVLKDCGVTGQTLTFTLSLRLVFVALPDSCFCDLHTLTSER